MIDIPFQTLTGIVREAAHPLTGSDTDYDPLMELIGDARYVLIGEASHGTHEFYAERARITRRLVEEKGFSAVAVEADWPDAYRINRHVRGIDAAGVPDPLDGFKRFPSWMWRNTVVLDFVRWLRTHNDALDATSKTGFYGLDLYSLYTSIEAVVGYLDKVDAEAARRARHRYGCFEHFGEDTHAYGWAASFDLGESCEKEVIDQLVDLRRHADEYARRDGMLAEDEYFFAEQNARLVTSAEEYYRIMFHGQISSWNLRDTHMFETLEALKRHLDRHGRDTKIVVWAHNSHLGDARATEMAERHELNLGQLVRQRHASDAILIGFSTNTGTVTAASNWDEPAELKDVRPALTGSYERLFHESGAVDFLLRLRENDDLVDALGEPRLERAIGVIYRPQTERLSHYFYARLPEQFDAIIHLDTTRAVQPLEPGEKWHAEEEPPETFPSAV